MLDSLEDAWRWYRDTRALVKVQKHIAKFWDALPWAGPLGKDPVLQHYAAADLEAHGKAGKLLNDLAIVVLFSVFESQVRQHVLREVCFEEGAIKHRTIKLAISEAKERIEFGSFFHVMRPFKDGYHDLVEQIDQVRQYRNWVAHGRRGSPDNDVTPELAYDRLRQFLQVLEGQSGPPIPGG